MGEFSHVGHEKVGTSLVPLFQPWLAHRGELASVGT